MKKILFAFLLLFSISLFARPAIMLTGYWAPTSEMMYRFSTDPELNPDGWIGEDWEGYGYDVYAFFPAFDISTRAFEVDYQNTWDDFWATVEEIHPEMIISYGAGTGEWEIEHRARNLTSWYPDDEAPYYPTPNPPDDTVEVGYERFSSLPKERIKAAVNAETDITAWIDYNGNPGAYLCEFIAYLGMWYHDMHSDPEDEFFCQSAGFIHVNAGVDLTEATEAVEVTLRTTIEYFQNLFDLEGLVTVNSELTDPCQITMTDEFDAIYNITTESDGSFSYENIPSGVYDILATSGRYFYYEGTVELNLDNDFLEIHLDEYLPSETLTWSSSPEQLINEETLVATTIASYFPPEVLSSYLDSHFRSFGFTAPDDSENCAIYLKLYRGNPEEDELTELYSSQVSDFSTGDYVEYELSDIIEIDEEYIEAGLTVGYLIVNNNHNIGWMDNEPANPHGNLIKIGANWFHADEQFGFNGNWDLHLGFNEVTDSEPDEIQVSALAATLNNYPNPFNPSTEIKFTTKEAEDAKIEIYNAKGQMIKSYLIPATTSSSTTSVNWNGTDHFGNPVSSGIYFTTLKSGNKVLAQRKMMLLK